MIIDSHCHAWERWPYDEPVPDRESRGRAEQLLYEMDLNGIDKAVVICAGLGGNDGNNRYVAEHPQSRAGRLIPFADIDSRWLATHKTAGGGDRLRAAVAAWNLRGFTHYLNEDDDGDWLLTADGLAFLGAASDLGLILSLACCPRHLRVVTAIAERFPTLPIICHHMALISVAAEARRSGLVEVAAAARHPNVFIKISGFGYVAPPTGRHPYEETGWVVRALYEFFGAERLCWGSDYPVVRRYMTYRQSLDVARHHCGFMQPVELDLVFGGTIARLVAVAP